LVKSLNSEGVWSLKPYQLSVVVVPPFWKTKWFFALIFVLTIAGFYGYTVLKTKKIRNENRILELKVRERTQEIAQKNRDITSSIEYAKRIQTALLPDFSFLKKEFGNAFIFYLPKDIVSGDFYWAGKKDGIKIIAAVDCTGHGVPGAFMSLIGNNLLNQIILEKGITMPDEILNRLNIEVQNALKQSDENSETNDGMDVSILCWNEKNEFFWAGANRPLMFIENGKLSKHNGNKYPIGGNQFDTDRKFTVHKFVPKSKSMFYLFSDGYADQFGGEKGKKFMIARLTELLLQVYDKELNEQLNLISERYHEWKNGYDQVDDILFIGVKT
jgi:serine phosphatase RsbU (regulator of sigma subunit)